MHMQIPDKQSAVQINRVGSWGCHKPLVNYI